MERRHKSLSTTQLMRMLKTSPNRFMEQQVMGNDDNMTFGDYLYQLMEQRKVTPTQLISNSYISKTYFYQSMNGERSPGRDVVLRIALSLQLSVDETQHLLTYAGKGILYPKQRRDAAILYCLSEGKGLLEADEMLTDLGELSLISE